MIKKIHLIVLSMMLILPTSLSFGDFSYLTFLKDTETDLKIDSFEKFYNIYNFKYKTDDQGRTLTIVHMSKYSFEFRTLVRDILGLSINNYIDRMNTVMSTGTGAKIKIAKNSSDMISIISETPISVGYVENTIYINGGDDVSKINVCNFLNCS
jgi:hypothetical protein